MATQPSYEIPDYSYVAKKGQIVGDMLNDMGKTIGSVTKEAMDAYKNNRSNKTLYEGVSDMVDEKKETFGLSDDEAEAIKEKLRYRNDEKISDYEKRIAPTLLNITQFMNYKDRDESFDIDMPNPFVDNQAFASEMAERVTTGKGKALNEAISGDQGGGLEPGTDISNIKNDMEEQKAAGRIQGITQPKTKEEAKSAIAGRLGNRTMTEDEMSAYPAYSALKSEKDVNEQEKNRLNKEYIKEGINLRKTQAGANNALTQYRTTSSRVKALAKTKDLQELEDYKDVARLETAAREELKDIKKRTDDGEMNEEWLDMKELVDSLRAKRKELSGDTGSGEIEPSMEAKGLANEIQMEISEKFDMSEPSVNANAGALELSAQKLNQFAMEKGVAIDYDRIKSALQQGSTVSDIAERIIMAEKEFGESAGQSETQRVTGASSMSPYKGQ